MKDAHARAWIWLLLGLVASVVVYVCMPEKPGGEIVIAWTGALWAVTHFLHQHELEKNRFFFELFAAFNERYDRLNNRLLEISDRGNALTVEDRGTVVDYFNLCAEEYLFYSRGYIPIDVWRAWRSGMNCFARNENFRALWLHEKESDSYYGFDFLSE